MKALFVVFACAFAASALAWFFTWAIWIHAPEGWYGHEANPVAMAARSPALDLRNARRQRCYRVLKLSTVLLFAASAALLWLWHVSEP